MSLEVKSTKDLGLKGLNLFVYGPPKAGKTSFAGTLPNPLIISMEDGLVGFRGEAIDYIRPESWQELVSIVIDLQSKAEPGFVTYKDKKYKSVVVDPLNEFYTVVMKAILKMTPGREAPKLPDYQLAPIRVEALLVDIINLPVHVCVTCLESTDKDELTGRIYAGPLVPGKFAKKVPALFDFVFHAETELAKDGKSVTYVLLTKSQGIVNAGGRYGKVKVNLREPADFTSLQRKIMGA